MSSKKFETLTDIYKQSTASFGPRDFLGEKVSGAWKWMTYSRFASLVDDLRAGLAQSGVQRGDRVAVISDNKPEWAVACYATYTLGGAYVPMYEAQQPYDWNYILKDSGAKVVFVANEHIASQIESMRDDLPKLERVIRFKGGEGPEQSYEALLKLGADTPTPLVESKPSDLAALIYTSGTTGKPKGVMLSHSNIALNVTAVHQIFDGFTPDDRSLAFLPWAHVFGQVVELHLFYSIGASIAVNDAVDKLIENLSVVRPTVLFAVPRIFNRIYDALQKRMASESAVKRALFQHTQSVATQRKELAEKGEKSALLELQWAVLDKVVASKVRDRFGGRLRYAISGGSAISTVVGNFIDNLGITVYEGYGLTETSPIATANYPGHRRLGSVGKPPPGVRIEIDRSVTGDERDGEIVIHGHNVMLGYYNLPEENAKAFTGDGGFRSGDMGHIDEDGFLVITGRIKEQYKLENGKYVVPVPIEEALKLNPFIANAMVDGANRPFNVALIVPDMDTLKEWAQNKGLDTNSIPELLKNPAVQSLFREQIAEATRQVKGYERPQRFLLLGEDFTTDNDMMTPKMSLKRRVIMERYKGAIDALYSPESSAA
jgi:long-chain acyl-CoA synthetase